MLPNLNGRQLNRVSEIYMGIGLVVLASLAIPALIDRTDIKLLILSVILSILFWISSVNILRTKV